ncbi:MAG: transcription-repair coupling factor [Clostridia bacterium]|nr:transcription-repair coupling factor [Clostridia bacterium]
MSIFLSMARSIPCYAQITENCKKGPVQVTGLNTPAKLHLAGAICAQINQNTLYITDSDYAAKKVAEELSYALGDRVCFYPAKELEFFKADARSHEVMHQRLEVIERLTVENSGLVVVMSIDALLQFTVDIKEYKESAVSVSVGEEISIESLSEKLVRMGYAREDMVEGKGQFSVRGGIVDVFPPTAENPCRIELFGDEVDSIRSFDVFTQVSVENIEDIRIGPADESFRHQNAETCVLQYFGDNTYVFFDEPRSIGERAEGYLWDIEETVTALAEKNPEFQFQEAYIHNYFDVLAQLLTHPFICLSELSYSVKDFKIKAEYSVPAGEIGNAPVERDRFYEELRDWLGNGYTVLFSVERERQELLAADLGEAGFLVHYAKNDTQKDRINYIDGGLKKGFYYEGIKVAFFGEEEIFGRAPKRRLKRKKMDSAARIRSFTDLDIGDYVVHHTHGIGQYMGLDTLEVEGKRHDYLKIKYNGDDFLYVPTDQLDILQKYVGKDGTIRLNKMGGADFARQKRKVKESTAELARELVALYAARQQAKGYSFAPDTEWQKSFEEDFPYEETDDQLRSIMEVKQDMESERPMDRLLCGDVGYGKTEIALRAAFKAVMDSKQVAYLAPTTVLVMQHFNTFLKRMEKYPIRVAELSRFKTKKEQEKIVKQLKSGEIDIVIGTHRLLAKDIEFKDLGLLVVDEEQRFGVKHKERIKEMKHNVDVLTLSATPIPRTLHMSMINIRDMSVLTEPPENRFPVRTIVMEQNDAVTQDAIRRELSRGGQVYYIHNRISSIDSCARKLQKAFPDAKITVAHGAMEEEPLEEIMMEMLEGQIDILVCTTIIETGLDIPNVNTIIIEDSNRMGLSQLYQLKGRVGRSGRRAFAYFLYRPDRVLNETATKRLKAIKEFTEFGSGFKIAMRDLEIRGAGNILGAEQHGHMDTVGYDMYCELLAQSVSELSGVPLEEDWQPTVDINVEAYIPPSYIKNHSMRLDIYKKIASIENEADKLEVEGEICDRFGDLPKAVSALISVAEVKYLAKECSISEITVKEEQILFYIKDELKLEAIAGLVSVYGNKFFVSAGTKPYMVLKADRKIMENLLLSVKKLLEEYKKCLQ